MLKLFEKLMALHPEVSLAVAGCFTKGISRKCCEYDIVLLSGETAFVLESTLDDCRLDLVYLPFQKLKRPLTMNERLLLALAQKIQDPDLLFSALQSDLLSRPIVKESIREFAFDGLSKISRAEESLTKQRPIEASFWLMCSAYIFCRCAILQKGSDVSPSHLLEELREKRPDLLGEGIVHECLGLELANIASTTRRLEALRSLVQCIPAVKLDTGFSVDGFDQSYLGGFGLSGVERKASYLMQEHHVVDAFCYLGHELCRFIEAYYLAACTKVAVSPLWSSLFHDLASSQNFPSSLREDFTRFLGLDADTSKIERLTAELKGALQKMAVAYP